MITFDIRCNDISQFRDFLDLIINNLSPIVNYNNFQSSSLSGNMCRIGFNLVVSSIDNPDNPDNPPFNGDFLSDFLILITPLLIKLGILIFYVLALHTLTSILPTFKE